jgi:sulfur-oxidizing protein SoxB
MSMSRREFLQVLAAASAGGFALHSEFAQAATAAAHMYETPKFGNVSLLHMTDCHAQLLPIYFREPDLNLGLGTMRGQVPHLVGEHLLKQFGIPPNTPEAYAFTCLDFEKAARTYGKVGGFAHLATLVKQVKSARPGALLLDGGDTWQGSGTALWSNAQDMVDACKLLGVDLMTLHWDCTYGMARVKEIEEKDFAGQIEIVAQNVKTADFGDSVFKPYVIKAINGVPLSARRSPTRRLPTRAGRWLTGTSVSRTKTCRKWWTKRAARARRSSSCSRTTAWTSTSSSPRACAASTLSSVGIRTTACRSRWSSKIAAGKPWSPMPARTANT